EQGMESCTKNGDGTYKDDGSGSGTWTCQLNDVWWHQTLKLSDKRVEHMRAQVLNDATGWDDPTCQQVGCGAQAEAEPANDLQIYGNFTHDDTSLTDVRKASTGWASMAAKEVADQRHEDAKVQAVGEASSAAVAAYDKTLPDDGAGSASDLIQPKDIERFDAATFTWVGGNNYTDNPYVDVERCTANCGDPAHASYQPFADQSGEIPVIVHYPGGNASCGDPSCVPGTAQALTQGMVGYRLGVQVWKWT